MKSWRFLNPMNLVLQRSYFFMEEAEFKYNFGINKLAYEPGISLKEVCTSEIISNVFRLQIFKSYRKHVAKYFKNPF